MKKEIIEEVLRMRLLSNYDNKSTLTENREVIFEGVGQEASKVVKTGEEIAKTQRALAQQAGKELETALEAGAKLEKLTVSTIKGATLRTTEEIMSALRKGLLSETQATKVFWRAFRNTNDPKLLEAVSTAMMKNETFVKKYGSLNKEAFLRIVQKERKVGPKQAQSLWEANRQRLSSLDNVVDATKNVDNVVDATKNVDNVVDAGKGINIQITNQVSNTVGENIDQLAKTKGFDDSLHWKTSDPEGYSKFFGSEVEKVKSKKGIFSRFIDWKKRSILFSALFGIAKWGTIGYGVWWLYKKLQSMDIETICDEGQHMKEGVGCVPNKTGGEGNDETGTGGGGGTKVITDNQGNKYQECVDIYYKGCVNKSGNTDIKKAQDCLGVTPNGFFNQETEDALNKKINKKSFSASDLPTICARSLGSSGFEI